MGAGENTSSVNLLAAVLCFFHFTWTGVGGRRGGEGSSLTRRCFPEKAPESAICG